jgi:putative ABC transport system permease protein
VWRALFRKGRADIVSRPLQSILLLVVVIAGVTSLTLAILVRESSAHSFQEFITDANGGHAWIFSTEQTLESVADRPEVVETGEPMAALDGGRLISSTTPYNLSFFGIGDQVPSVVPGVVTHGRWLEPGADDEAVLDRGVAFDAGIEVGDTIEVSARGGTGELTVVGLVIPTSRAPFPVWETARIFVTKNRLIELGGGSSAYFAAGFVLDNPDAAPLFVDSVLGGYRNSGGRPWQLIRDDVVEENDAIFILMSVFATFALGASIFIIANAITSQVQAQVRDVGLLKAVGFTPTQVAMLLVGETLLLCGVAAAVGLGAGWALAPLFLDRIRDWLGQTSTAAPGWPQIAFTLLGVAALATVASMLPAWNAGRTTTVEAIRGRRLGSTRGAAAIARVAGALHLPRFVVMGLKDLFTHPTRAWLTIAAVAVAAAAVVATLTIEGTGNGIEDDPRIVGGEPFELELEAVLAPGTAGGEEVPRISDDEIVALIQDEPAVGNYLTRSWIPITISGNRYGAYAVGGHYREFDYPLLKGRMMSPVDDDGPFEAIVGFGLAADMELDVGDAIQFTVQSPIMRSYELEVVGVYIDNDNDGRIASFDISDIRRLAPNLETGAYGLKIADDEEPGQVATMLIANSDGRVVVETINDDIQDDIDRIRGVVRPVMLTLSVFLIAMVSINLLSTLQLSVRERTREIGLLKAIGFTPMQVVSSIVTGATVLAAIGAAIGVPAGWIFVRFVFEQSAENDGYDAGAVVQRPEWFWFVGLAFLSLLVAALGSAVPARGAAVTPVSTALRYE